MSANGPLAAEEVRGADLEEKNAILTGLSAELKRIATLASRGRSHGVLRKLDDLRALADGGTDDLLSGGAADAFITMLDRAQR